jgi:histidyl-tRNA synthetase
MSIPPLQPVRGTHDLIGQDYDHFTYVEATARHLAARYGFRPIATPIFEFSRLFKRSLGDESDVVSKEMYTFTDRNGEELTLRPEGTAPVARALISNKLAYEMPQKFYYSGPMFRYERPQKGRMRQFHQLAAELFGVFEPTGDVEVIALAAHVLADLKILDQVTLELNTLGDTDSRTRYRDALVNYLTRHQDQLSADSQRRLLVNPLRILDSKAPEDKAIVAEAPRLSDYLTDDSRIFFEHVCQGLDQLGIAYVVNPLIVRGLDYYCHTTFEFVTTALGAQGTVLAGGRYNGLVSALGGPDVPGVGWAAGIERLMALAPASDQHPVLVSVIPVDEVSEPLVMPWAQKLRQAGIHVDMAYTGNGSKRLKRANKAGATFVVLVSSEHTSRGEVVLKSMHDGTQQVIPATDLVAKIRAL